MVRYKKMTAVGVALLLGSALAAAPVVPGKGPAAAARPAAVPAAKPKPGPDLAIMKTQVILDHLGFSPGVIDGRAGAGLKRAIAGFQKANGVVATGEIDQRTGAALDRFNATQPVREIVLTEADLAGQFVGPIPHKEDEQAKLPSLGYSNPLEMLSERYHTTNAVLIALNSPNTPVAPGAKIKVPDVVTAGRAYPADIPEAYKQTLAGLNVDSSQPKADHLVVSKADKTLSVYDAQDKLLAQFPVTTGSSHDPLPIGTWKIMVLDYNPTFHFNPKLFWDAKKGEKSAMLPAGPNGPVGVIWMDLNKEHYGIHGTPVPENIGRTASHGCVRMTNWDAARLSLMVKPGTPAIFQP
ncbi:L,D-transpeptidase family protein [Sphingomonas abietis]|uniref:L,D-transpeptidase family protein n=1 Tax=Sphingomonas abietis TaxID=3012344 RepID=A0ABY7NQ37_9SPHN|nr:L,D-transpeptidase family protein [Sphingomonas abietis]WBO23633.1 L,D-transpeptidase family protein [Sphingomonas abietis]